MATPISPWTPCGYSCPPTPPTRRMTPTSCPACRERCCGRRNHQWRVTRHDLTQFLGKGSLATSLEELPQPVISALPGFVLLVLAKVLGPGAPQCPPRNLVDHARPRRIWYPPSLHPLRLQHVWGFLGTLES